MVFHWGHFYGGLLTSELPYIVVMIVGMILVKTELMNHEGIISICKLCIEVFIPCYIFIAVCGSTSASQIIENAPVIISQLIMIAIAIVISLLYCHFAKADVRTKWTILSLVAISEIKHLSQFQNNTFCYHLDTLKTDRETAYCTDIKKNHNSHLFFQAFLTWYIFYYLIRKDKEKNRIIVEVGRATAHADQKPLIASFNASNEKEDDKEKDGRYMKKLYDDNHIKNTEKTESTLFVDHNLYGEIVRFYNKYILKKSNVKSFWYKSAYIFFGPCQVTMFCGLVAGFITPVKYWIFDKTKAQVMFFDSFYYMGVSHLVISYLIIGSSMLIKHKSEYRYEMRIWDHVFVAIMRCFIFPFIGVLYGYIAYSIVPDNRVVAFNSFLQWFTPSSIDLIIISHAKDINTRDVGLSIFIQWLMMFIFGNFTSISAFLGAVQLG